MACFQAVRTSSRGLFIQFALRSSSAFLLAPCERSLFPAEGMRLIFTLEYFSQTLSRDYTASHGHMGMEVGRALVTEHGTDHRDIGSE